jgi:predicted transport protein
MCGGSSASSTGPTGGCGTSHASAGQRSDVVVYLKADPQDVDLVPGFTRDVSTVGHHGTGDLELWMRTEKDLERAGDLLRLSYAAA